MSNVKKLHINYFSVPTLKTIATVRVVTTYLYSDKCKNEALPVGKFRPYMFSTRAEVRIPPDSSRILPEREQIISILPLPVSLKYNIACIFMPLELQRYEWVHTYQFTEKTVTLQEYEWVHTYQLTESTLTPHWSNEGTIDRKKSLEDYMIHHLPFLEDSSYRVTKIFELACNYCLETCIPKIWDKLPEATRNNYLCSTDVYKFYGHHLLAYWIFFPKGELSELMNKIVPHDSDNIYNNNHSIYRNMFTLGLSRGNIMAVKYFWGKLADDEKYINLIQWVNYTLEKGKYDFQVKKYETYQRTSGFCDVLYFLLSQMTDSNQQKEIFQKNSLFILNSLFFYWPWQRFLLPTLEVMWDYLDEKVYIIFMSLIVYQINKGYFTEKILRKIWRASPSRFIKYFIRYVLHSPSGTDVFCRLLLLEDIDTIQMILKDTDINEKKSLIFCVIENKYFLDVIYLDKLHVFDLLVKNTLTSISDIQDLKISMSRIYGTSLMNSCLKNDNLGLLEKFCDWAFISEDQIAKFKNEIFDKREFLITILFFQTSFEFADYFLNWYCTSKEEVNKLKKHFALFRSEIIDRCDFQRLEKFVQWCFVSDIDIKEFKFGLLQDFSIIQDALRSRYDFEYAANLINWCCESKEEMREYKGRFVLSDEYMEILKKFTGITCFSDGTFPLDYHDLTIKLIILFSPLEERVTVELKEKIRNTLSNCGDYLLFLDEECLFRMIDDANGNISDKSSTANA